MMYEADWGQLHIIICGIHLEEYGNELKVSGEAAEYINCYFCVKTRGAR